MKKILITDGMSSSSISDLKNSGYQVDEKFYESAELGNALKDYDAVVIRSATKINQTHIDEALNGNLKLIIRGGVGVDNIDVAYAEKKGISVRNTPGASSKSVAELAMAHMFSIARFLPASKLTLSNGKWEKKKYTGTELGGKTLGIVGMGKIGQELAKMASAIGMNIAYHVHVNEIPNLPANYKKLSLCDLYKECDYISLHVPLKKGAPAIIGKNEISTMKDGAVIINCARGGVVDEVSLIEALDCGKLGGAGIDVYQEEPTKNATLVCHPSISVTPHIGAQTKEAQDRVGSEVVEIIKNFFEK